MYRGSDTVYIRYTTQFCSVSDRRKVQPPQLIFHNSNTAKLHDRIKRKNSNILNDKRIKSCLSRFDSSAYSNVCSFCVRSAILSALIRSPCSRVSTAAAAAAARSTTRQVRCHLQQRRPQRRRNQKIDRHILYNIIFSQEKKLPIISYSHTQTSLAMSGLAFSISSSKFA